MLVSRGKGQDTGVYVSLATQAFSREQDMELSRNSTLFPMFVGINKSIAKNCQQLCAFISCYKAVFNDGNSRLFLC